MDNNWLEFWNHYWWLVFPLFWMIFASFRHWGRHAQAQKTLDILKSYADQGKDPPPELLAALQRPVLGRGCDRADRYSDPTRCLRRTIIFGVLAVVFAALAFLPRFGHHHDDGLIITAAVFGALTLGNLLSLLIRPRDPR